MDTKGAKLGGGLHWQGPSSWLGLPGPDGHTTPTPTHSLILPVPQFLSSVKWAHNLHFGTAGKLTRAVPGTRQCSAGSLPPLPSLGSLPSTLEGSTDLDGCMCPRAALHLGLVVTHGLLTSHLLPCWHPHPEPAHSPGSACIPRGRAPWWVPLFSQHSCPSLAWISCSRLSQSALGPPQAQLHPGHHSRARGARAALGSCLSWLLGPLFQSPAQGQHRTHQRL